MCRTTDFHGFPPRRTKDNRLKVIAFYVRLSGLKADEPVPESLTLLYLPRINETELSLDGSKVRPDSTAFLTLDRVINAKTEEGEAAFGSRERVRAGEGFHFEVYLGEGRILKGRYRRNDEEDWKLECKCGLESDAAVVAGADVVVVAVAVEGQPALIVRVEMAAKQRKGNSGKKAFNKRLEAIPEDREDGDDDGSDGGGGCDRESGDCGCDGGGLEETRGPDCRRREMEMDLDLEGVRWAVEVGIWIFSLGMGFLVSKASAKSLGRFRIP